MDIACLSLFSGVGMLDVGWQLSRQAPAPTGTTSSYRCRLLSRLRNLLDD